MQAFSDAKQQKYIWSLEYWLKFECEHMAPNSKPVVKVERCRQNLNRSLHDLLWFMNYYLATHSMYLDILTASYITEEYMRTKRKYKCTLSGRRLKKLPCRFVENDTKGTKCIILYSMYNRTIQKIFFDELHIAVHRVIWHY